jgi:hypothetical protein
MPWGTEAEQALRDQISGIVDSARKEFAEKMEEKATSVFKEVDVGYPLVPCQACPSKGRCRVPTGSCQACQSRGRCRVPTVFPLNRAQGESMWANHWFPVKLAKAELSGTTCPFSHPFVGLDRSVIALSCLWVLIYKLCI